MSRQAMPRPSEKRRITIACENCRARKVRCDGCRPVCRACARRDDACKYTVSLAPWDRRRQKYVEELEKRLDELETGSTPQTDMDSTGTQHVSPSRSMSHPGGLDPADAPSSMFDHDWQGNTGSQVAPDCPPQLAGSLHLGQSSTGVFIRELHRSIAKPAGSPSAKRGLALGDLGRHTSHADDRSASTASDYLLPPRHTANELLSLYWSEHYPLYPAISKGEFVTEFDALYTGAAPPPSSAPDRCRMTHCLANLMFALAERSKRRESPSSAHLDYFGRAKRLLHFDIFGDLSFQVIQALVLCAQYLQSSEKPRQCWVIVGLGIRAAQSMGLHLSEVVKNLESERDRHLAAVVWSCLVTMDRTLSMTLGRAPTLSLSAARAVGVVNCTQEVAPDDGQESTGPDSFFCHSYRLFDILHEILLLLYREDPRAVPVIDVISHTSRLEKELDQWTRGLPEHLNFQYRQGGSDASGNQAYFLRQRYLQVCIILLRPGLSVIIKTAPGAGWDLEEATSWYCAKRCIEAAREMADIVVHQVHAQSDAHSAMKVTPCPWWYSVQFCYNAGVSLLAARLSSRTAERMGIRHLDESIVKCVEALKFYGSLSPTATRCLSAFSSVADKAGYALPSMPVFEDASEVPPFDFDSIDLRNIEGFTDEGYWGLNWINDVSPIFDQFGSL